MIYKNKLSYLKHYEKCVTSELINIEKQYYYLLKLLK